MKNYYDQKHELHIAKLRLKSLKETKEMYFNHTQPGAMKFDSERVQGGIVKNKFETYVEKVEEINVQIKLVEAEIIILEENLKDIENALRYMKDPLVKIFVMRYIDNKSIRQICKETSYSRAQIYRKLKQIRNVTKNETK